MSYFHDEGVGKKETRGKREKIRRERPSDDIVSPGGG